jgi:hypothetical protein
VETPVVTPPADPRRRPIDLAWAAIPPLVAGFASLLGALRAIDLAYHLRLGGDLIDTNTLARADSFTFSVNGAAWTNQQWGAQVLLSALYQGGGWELLAVTRAALVAAAFLLVYLACRGRGASPRTSSLLALGSFVVALPSLSLRPQLFAIPLFALGLWVLATRGRHPGRLWALPVLALLVANLHGSFPLFVALAGYALAEDLVETRPWRSSAVLLATTAVATFITPFGPGVWLYAVDIATNPTVRDAVQEWRPLSFAGFLGIVTVLSVVGVLVLLGRRPRPVRWLDLVWLVLFLVPAFASGRAAVWWALVAPVTVAGWLTAERRSAEPDRSSPLPAAVIIATLVVAVVIALPWVRGGPTLRDAPGGLADALADLPDGAEVFVHQPWASWVEFASPHVLVYVDSRIELFPEEVWRDYGEVAFSRAGWREALGRSRPDAIVADKDSWDLIPFLRDAETWDVAAEDDEFVLFVRVG